MRTARFMLWLAWINLAFLVFEAVLNAVGTVFKV
jgi:hypothetical protein